MGTSTMSSKKYKPKGQKKRKSFPWIGLILVILGLAAMFYFIDPPDANKVRINLTTKQVLILYIKQEYYKADTHFGFLIIKFKKCVEEE